MKLTYHLETIGTRERGGGKRDHIYIYTGEEREGGRKRDYTYVYMCV